MTFRVGQKVVCVKQPCRIVNNLGLPNFEKGRVYTIARLGVVEPYGMFIYVEELDPLVSGHVRGFRPIVETKSEISFTQGAPKDSKRFDNRRKVRERA